MIPYCKKMSNKDLIYILNKVKQSQIFTYANIIKVKNILLQKSEKSLEDSIKSAYLWEKRKFKYNQVKIYKQIYNK